MGNARPFKGIENTQLGGNRDPFLVPNDVVRDLSQPKEKNVQSSREARYVIRLDAVQYKPTRKKGDFFTVKLSVMAGDGPSAKGTGIMNGQKVYSRAIVMIKEASDYFQRDVMRLVCAAMNAPPTKFTNSQGQQFPGFTESDFEVIISKTQPLTGRYALVTVDYVKTGGGFDFTTHRWEPIEPVMNGADIVDWKKPAVDNVTEFMAVNQDSVLS